MVARGLFAVAIAVLLLGSSGCCWVRRVLCDECCSGSETGAFTYFAGRSCGEAYWGDWHSHPPKCDPCDSCGYEMASCQCGGGSHGMIHSASAVTTGSGCQSCGH